MTKQKQLQFLGEPEQWTPVPTVEKAKLWQQVFAAKGFLQDTKQRGRQVSNLLQPDLWLRGFLREEWRSWVSHGLVTFLDHSFRSQHVYGLQVSGLVVPDPGICKLILPQRNSLSLCVNDDVHSISFSIAMVLSTTTMILVIWLWLISVQLAQAWGQRGQEWV